MREPHWRQLIRRLYREHWNIEVRPPYAHGRGVALYLARYVKGGPLPKDRPLELHEGTVRFSYTDHRDGRIKTMCLSALEFIERVLWHAPPRGQHTVRRAGLYSSAHREHHHQAMQLLAPLWQQPSTETAPQVQSCALSSPPPPCCPQCSRPLLRLPWPPSTHQFGEISIHPPSPPPSG